MTTIYQSLNNRERLRFRTHRDHVLKANGTTFTPHHLPDRVSLTLTMNDSVTPAGLCIHNGTLDRVTAPVTATKTKRSTEHLPLCIVAHRVTSSLPPRNALNTNLGTI